MDATPRLIFNDDGSNFLYSWDGLTAEDLRAYLRRLAGTQVDLVAYCVAFGGYVTYYNSQVAERLGSGFGVTDKVKQARVADNLRRLDDECGGYITGVFDILRELGLPVVASFRMNDAHMSSDPTGMVAGRFWMNHPQWRLGEPYGYYGSCLDYRQPAVREYLRRLVREVIELYPDLAGIELDGMRSPFFFPEGEGERCAPIMTELIRQIRDDLDEVRRSARGSRGTRPVQDVPAHAKRYQLRVNVPRSPELALQSGMDVATWDAEGLVDGISPGCYSVDFQPPMARWKQLLTHTPVHAYVNCSPQTGQYLSREEYRGAAANAWNAGADGINLFNFPCLDELSFTQPVPAERRPFPAPEFGPYGWHADQQQTRTVLHELGDPGQLRRADKRFLFCLEHKPYRHYVPEVAQFERLADPPELAFAFTCHEDIAAAREITLQFKLVGVSGRDQFAVALNDQAVPEERLQRSYCASGRDTRVHSVPLDPYAQITVRLTADELTSGANSLRVTLTERHPALLGAVQLREVALDVKY